MYGELAKRIKDYVISKQQRSIPFGPASLKDVEDAEAALGFSIPEILKSLYLVVGNGGFGPGQGGNIIGLRGGHASSPGTLVEQYEDIKRGAEYFGIKWRPGLLPFCDWGCTIFSCVDCNDPGLRVYLCEACHPQPLDYGLAEFMEMWIKGMDLLDQTASPRKNSTIVNPFTGKKSDMKGTRSE